MSETLTARWILGSCARMGDTVELKEISGVVVDDEGCTIRSKAVQKSGHSVVLFKVIVNVCDHQELIPISIVSRNVKDTAAILEAGRKQCSDVGFPPGFVSVSVPIDRMQIKQHVLKGDSPIIPPSRSLVHQWFLKRSMALFFHRPTVEFFAARPHRMASLCYFSVRRYPTVRGHIALSLDDAPGRLGPYNSCLEEIRTLLNESGNAKATFMVVDKFIPGHEQNLIKLLQEGHELGNHGAFDQAHDGWTQSEFLQAVDSCSERIRSIQQQAGVSQGVRYFRAPHGIYTKQMERLIQARNMQNVMCDAYSCDPIVEDGEYLATCLLRQARHGGIILLHIPEVGFRSYCMIALRKLLDGLRQRGLKVVSVGMLETLAKKSSIQ